MSLYSLVKELSVSLANIYEVITIEGAEARIIFKLS